MACDGADSRRIPFQSIPLHIQIHIHLAPRPGWRIADYFPHLFVLGLGII